MLLNVQVLRGLAALLVVFVHLEMLAKLAGLPAGSTVFGNSGVDLFFIISGLIMVMTTASGRQTPLGFLRNRATRIVPLYWLLTLVVFGVALLAPALMQSTVADPVQLLKSLAFIPFQRADGFMHPTVFVGWTLNYEMLFYLLFAAGMLLPGRYAGLAFTGLLLAGTVIAGRVLQPRSPIMQFYTAPIMLEFAAGMLLGVVLPKLPAVRALGPPAVILGVAALAVMLAGPWLWRDTDRAVMFGLPATVVVACALLAERSGLILRQGWIQLLGAASYSIYLTHFFCTQLAVKAAAMLAGFGPIVAIVLLPLAFLLVVVVGAIVHRHVELPLTELARRCFAPLRAHRALAAEVETGPAQNLLQVQETLERYPIRYDGTSP